MPTPQKFYGRQITQHQKELRAIKHQIALTASLRLASFGGAILALFILYPISPVGAFICGYSVVRLLSFLWSSIFRN
jgi:hypothetical protein